MPVDCLRKHECGKFSRDFDHAVQVSLPVLIGENLSYNCDSLLFAGLLINRDSLNPAFQWLHTVSFFHAAYEALAVNELRYLQLKEKKVRFCQVPTRKRF